MTSPELKDADKVDLAVEARKLADEAKRIEAEAELAIKSLNGNGEGLETRIAEANRKMDQALEESLSKLRELAS